MPFKSAAQRRWGNSPEGIKALGGPAKVAEWNDATKGMKLPERIGPKRVPKMHPADSRRDLGKRMD